MKKVLLCERTMSGHRRGYLEGLTSIPGVEFFCFAPENIGLDQAHFYECTEPQRRRSAAGYLRWVAQIRRIAKQNRIDVVHIADGDSIMRYFGLGLHGIENVVITYHHFFPGLARKISYCTMNLGRKRVSVAHTQTMQQALEKAGIRDVRLCEYPAFSFDRLEGLDGQECRARFGLPKDVPVIGIIGGMTSYKNIPEYLKILRDCKEDFHILICGMPGEISEESIREAIAPYADRVTALFRRLTDEEYEAAILASDIIYCLYNHDFDGASGPLTDGVCAQKMILSCAHGSLGNIVTQNHLGLTAECTDEEQVLEQTERAMRGMAAFCYDKTAENYRASLMPENFRAKYRAVYESADM